MKLSSGKSLLSAALIAAAWAAASCGPPAGSAPVGPAADAADQAFLEAARKGDSAALSSVLDANFSWISANGKTLDRAGTLASPPMPAIAEETGADVTRFTYGDAVETVEVNSGKMHELRIVVKRPEGWRVLVYQEVRSLDAPLAVTPGAGADCQNPCKSIPFTPQDATQRDVAAAYTALESSAVAQNADVWSSLTAYEFVGATSNAVKPLDKATRVAALQRKTMEGLAPTPLVSAVMYEFPNAVIMRSRHQPASVAGLPPGAGDPLEVTRLWTQRAGKWVIALSYQTAVQP